MAKGSQYTAISVSNAVIYLLNLIVLLMLILPLLAIKITIWWLDNLGSLQLQWSVVALLLLFINIHKGKKHLSALLLLFLLAVIYQQVSASHVNKAQQLTAQTLKIAQLNIHYQNPHIDKLLLTLNTADYDLLVLQEVGDDQRQKITTLQQTYPYFIADTATSDLALFSKWPIVDRKTHDLGYKGGHIIEAIVQSPKDSSPVHIFALHPASPRSADLWQVRNATLEYVAQQAHASLLPSKIIIGDLNTTPWSAQFQHLQKDSRLTYTSNAIAYIPSWSYNSSNPLIRLLSSAYIDHCLISDSLNVIRKDYQSIPGSDHQLLVTELGML